VPPRRPHPAVLQVDVKQCHYAGRTLLKFLAARCPGLATLSPSRWTDNGASWDLAAFTSLQELRLGDADVDILTLDDMALHALDSMQRLDMLSLQVGARHRLPRFLRVPPRASTPHTPAPPTPRLQRCRWISDAGCVALARIGSLRRLDLSHTDVGARGLAWLAALPHLHTLHLSDCRWAARGWGWGGGGGGG